MSVPFLGRSQKTKVSSRAKSTPGSTYFCFFTLTELGNTSIVMTKAVRLSAFVSRYLNRVSTSYMLSESLASRQYLPFKGFGMTWPASNSRPTIFEVSTLPLDHCSQGRSQDV